MRLLKNVTSSPYRGQVYRYLYGQRDSEMNRVNNRKDFYLFTTGYAFWAFLYNNKELATLSEPPSLQFFVTDVGEKHGASAACRRVNTFIFQCWTA